MNICFFTREYAHPSLGKTGGIGVFVKQFTQQLKTKGFQITVLTFGKDKANFLDEGVRVHKIKDSSVFNDWLRQPFQKYKLPGYITFKKFLEEINRRIISYKVSKFLKKNDFDIVEFHDYGGDAPYVKTKVPVVVRCHGSATTLHHFMGYGLRNADATFEPLVFESFSKYVVAVSQYASSTTQQAFNLKRKPTIIYNGVNIVEDKKKKNYLDNPTQGYSIWYLGSIRERKGVDVACKVFNRVVEKYPQTTFHVLGNNNNDHWNTVCIKLLSKKANSKTTYYGAVPNEKVNQYLEKAHLVLFPSYGENFSIALLEVMALGKVVITSNIPSFQEIIEHGENGLVANSENEYLDNIDWVFNNQHKLEYLSKNAKATIRNRFDINKVIRENIKYYQSILKNEK